MTTPTTATLNELSDALAVIQNVQAQWAQRAFLLMVYCGLRPAETCTIRWSDVNLEQSRLTVHPHLTARHAPGGASNKYTGRDVPVVADFVTTMKTWFQEDTAAHRAHNRDVQVTTVCTPPVTLPDPTTKLQHIWVAARNTFGGQWDPQYLQHPNDLRRLYTTLAMIAGIPVTTLATWLGQPAELLIATHPTPQHNTTLWAVRLNEVLPAT